MEVERDGAPMPDAWTVIDDRAVIRFGKIIENDVTMDHPSISRYSRIISLNASCSVCLTPSSWMCALFE